MNWDHNICLLCARVTPKLGDNLSPGSTQVNNTHVGAKYGFLFMELHIPCIFLAYSNVFPMYVHMCTDKYVKDDGIHTKSETFWEQWNSLNVAQKYFWDDERGSFPFPPPLSQQKPLECNAFIPKSNLQFAELFLCAFRMHAENEFIRNN